MGKGEGQASRRLCGRFSLFVSDTDGIAEIKGNRTGLGYGGIPAATKFINHEAPLSHDAAYYMISDGILDQVGGEHRRGFGKRRTKELLRTVRDMDFTGQKEQILKTFHAYQGDEERRDDVTMIGFRPAMLG